MWSDFWEAIFTNHRGKFFGLLLGLVAGILMITLGLLKTLVVVILAALGYYIGKRVDEEGSFRDFLEKILGGR